jgi:hypothetical protein
MEEKKNEKGIVRGSEDNGKSCWVESRVLEMS